MEFLLSLAGTKALPAAISRYEITRSGHLAKVRAADKALGVLKRETKLLFRAAGAQGFDRNLMKLAMRKNPQSIEQAVKKYLRLKSFLNVLEAGADAPAPTSTTVEEKEHAGE